MAEGEEDRQKQSQPMPGISTGLQGRTQCCAGRDSKACSSRSKLDRHGDPVDNGQSDSDVDSNSDSDGSGRGSASTSDDSSEHSTSQALSERGGSQHEREGSEARERTAGKATTSNRPRRQSHQVTSHALQQPGESVDCPSFNASVPKFMLEKTAGSGVYFQVYVQRSTKTELRVLFPAASGDEKAVKQWVARTSSRVWRGSMRAQYWKHLGQGRWAVRDKPLKRSEKARRGLYKAKRRRAGGMTDGTLTGAETGSDDAEHSSDTDGASRLPHAFAGRQLNDRSQPGVSAGVGRDAGADQGLCSISKPVKQVSPVVGDTAAVYSMRDDERSRQHAASDRCQAAGLGHACSCPLETWFRIHFVRLHMAGFMACASLCGVPEQQLPVSASVKQHSSPPCLQRQQQTPRDGTEAGGGPSQPTQQEATHNPVVSLARSTPSRIEQAMHRHSYPQPAVLANA